MQPNTYSIYTNHICQHYTQRSEDGTYPHMIFWVCSDVVNDVLIVIEEQVPVFAIHHDFWCCEHKIHSQKW
jgi:hypothetical protein